MAFVAKMIRPFWRQKIMFMANICKTSCTVSQKVKLLPSDLTNAVKLKQNLMYPLHTAPDKGLSAKESLWKGFPLCVSFKLNVDLLLISNSCNIT